MPSTPDAGPGTGVAARQARLPGNPECLPAYLGTYGVLHTGKRINMSSMAMCRVGLHPDITTLYLGVNFREIALLLDKQNVRIPNRPITVGEPGKSDRDTAGGREHVA